jgi:hypothetical protein
MQDRWLQFADTASPKSESGNHAQYSGRDKLNGVYAILLGIIGWAVAYA